LKGTRVLRIFQPGIKEKKLEIGSDNSRERADAMPSDFKIRCQTLACRNKRIYLQKVITKEADLPALCAMAEDPMNYHQ
jgi:hypothetical protein